MDLKDILIQKLNDYPSDEFWIDEHALKRCEDYIDLDLDEVLERLRRGKFDRVVRNDSKKKFSSTL
ncbi:MAG: hypothetical protein ABEJ99_04930 [Candidatus Nanohaloarchaea archaeon]